MDKLQQAFEVLGGVEWVGGEYEFSLAHDAGRGFWVDRRYGDGAWEWDWEHFCSDYEAENHLLRAMLEKAEEKYNRVDIQLAQDGCILLVGWYPDGATLMDYTKYDADTLFDALADALKNNS